MNERDGMAPGLTPEEQEKTMRNLKEMMRRQAEGRYRGAPAVPGKAESMLTGFSRVRRADGDPEPFPEEFYDDGKPSRGAERS